MAAELVAEPATTAHLRDALWPSREPRTGDKALHVHLSNLRAHLAPVGVVVKRDGGTYRLSVDRSKIDALVFLDEVRRARAALEADPAQARILLERALSRWQGEPFSPFDGEDFALGAIDHLKEARTTAEDLLIESWLRAGLAPREVAALRRLALEEPLRERRWYALVHALRASGQRAGALRAYQQARAELGAIGIEPSAELQDLERAILLEQPAGTSDRKAAVGNLVPPATDMVGRQAEAARLGDLFDSARLVTVVGPPGAGKTLFGLTVASRLAERFADGVWWVDLAAVRDPGLVPVLTAKALGLRARNDSGTDLHELLERRLAHRSLLLVVDNCEHLVGTVRRLVTFVLERSADLRVLATSRRPLDVTGEEVLPLGALGVPGSSPSEVEIAAAPAVQLLLRRATGLGGTTRSRSELEALAAICRSMDGLPLAIELAARWLRTVTPRELLVKLERHLVPIDGEPDGGIVAAALERSVDMLSEEAQRLYRALAVFDGAPTLDVLAFVAATDAAVAAPAVRELVESSLVQPTVDGQGNTRYRSLLIVRHDAEARLARDGSGGEVRARHAEMHRDIIWVAWPRIATPHHRVVLDALEPVMVDVLRALEWAIERGDAGLIGQLACGAFHYLRERGTHAERTYWLDRAARAAAQHPQVPYAALALAASALAAGTCDHAAARRHHAVQAWEVAENGGCAATKAIAGTALMYALCTDRAELRRVLAVVDQVVENASEARLVEYEAGAKQMVGLGLVVSGHREAGMPMLEEAVALQGGSGAPASTAAALVFLGSGYLYADEPVLARRAWTEAGRLARVVGNTCDSLHARMGLVRLDVEAEGSDLAGARRDLESLMEEFELVGDLGCRAGCLRMMAMCELAEGSDSTPLMLLLQAHRLARRSANPGELASCGIHLARMLGRDRPVEAAQLLGAADAKAQEGGLPPSPHERRLADDLRADLDVALGAVRRQELEAAGAAAGADVILNHLDVAALIG